VAPISGAQVLGGKVLGIFLSGAAQVGLLVALSAALFGLRWGNPAGVVLIILAAAAAATGWGLLVASLAGTPAQVGTIGTTLMLSFGILGGSFVPLDQSSPLLESLGMITPNKWALDGFMALADGGTLTDLAVPLAALLGMAVALFFVAAFIFRRRQTVLVTG
jgi:ABC-2 type transport system permease protein